MVKQCFIIFGCLAIGEFLAWITHCPVPGSILGMIVLTFLLQKKWVKAESIRPISRFLISNMGFFFVPPGVALMLYFDIIAAEWLPITVATVVSVIVVLICTGHVHQWIHHKFHKHFPHTPAQLAHEELMRELNQSDNNDGIHPAQKK